jgi:hypothetical protein
MFGRFHLGDVKVLKLKFRKIFSNERSDLCMAYLFPGTFRVISSRDLGRSSKEEE